MILALDSSQSAGSLALMDAGRLVYSAWFDIRITHSETLMPQLDAAFKLCGYSQKDLSGIVLCNGPGSFTGLRIGLATAKGIAFGLGIPVTTFNSLQLAALNCLPAGTNILALIDAKM
ncbi:MAG TPA: tRNA (adenosine(37)-N6)-threonylcarbamoyltransferase complex dimerization subunit type 1 TsaB, partial [Candidatus Cloacimonadota bacterium]|nr:tRNA (adenosine(37)-N6)-threonylcarbamoyltransferase complex dimerization subunit type 1 TsaB [Candidatus Cloacimonadota bacterium]